MLNVGETLKNWTIITIENLINEDSDLLQLLGGSPMILHCTLPYRQDIPNPALGYLKGFLQARGITVRNVYWNIVLARTVLDFHRRLEKYSADTGLSSISAITFFLGKHLLRENSKESRKTTLDLLYSSVFKKEEISEIVSSLKVQIDQYIQQDRLHETNLSGFTLKTFQWPMSYYTINRLKEMNPDSNVVIGGIFNEDQARAFMKIFNQVDYAIWGEGEYPLFYLYEALQEGTRLDKVPNLVYRDGITLTSTKETDECADLDSYPFADHTDYFATFRRFMTVQMPILIPIWGSRACPWNKCKFCILNEEYQYRVRSPQNIVKEIEFQVKNHNIDNIIFVDTELPGNRKRFKTLLQLLLKSSADRRRPYCFFAEISPVFIDAEIACLMQLASFESIQVGFEAVTDGLLQKMRKRHRFVHNIQALKLGDQYNLKITGLNIIREIPPETDNDVRESCTNVRFLRFLLTKYVLTPTFLMLFKGSPFYDEMPEDEREEWAKDPFWEEIVPLNLIPESERFEFFGFCTDSPTHSYEWDTFEKVLTSYVQQNRSYTWTEYPNGSFIEERGPRVYRYTLDRDETDILIFCDVIRKFSEVKAKFPHLSEDSLYRTMSNLNDAGMLYYDEDFTTIISILEATKRKSI